MEDRADVWNVVVTSALREKQKRAHGTKHDRFRGVVWMMRWIAMAFCFAIAAVPAYWAYGSFDALSSSDVETPGFSIVMGSVFWLASLAAVICGVMLFVLWPRFRDRDPRPRRARREGI